MRKPLSKASGRNDAWFGAACIVGIAGLGLCSEAKAQDVSANVALIPLALKGVKYRAIGAGALLGRNLLIYGLGGLIAPFVGIKLIDLLISGLGLA